MASSVASGASDNPRGYSVEPSEVRRKPQPASYNFDDETKISYSCTNGTLFLKLSSVLMIVSFLLQVIVGYV